MNHPLLQELQLFTVGKNAYHREEQPEGEKDCQQFSGMKIKKFYSDSHPNNGEDEFEAAWRSSRDQRHGVWLLFYDLWCLDWKLRWGKDSELVGKRHLTILF